MDLKTQLETLFQSDGYIVNGDTPEQLTYTPELILSKKNELKIFHIKEDSTNLKDSILQRIAQAKKIPSHVYEQFLVFPEKPTMKILSSCKLFGLGIYYQNINGSLEIYAEPKKIKGRTKKSQLPNTKIFFSSKQDLEERQLAKNSIDVQREAHKIPVWANLVEDDQRYDNNIEKILDIINDCMDDSEYVLGILGEEYRLIVDQEIRRALDNYDHPEILLFLKNNKEAKESWKDLLRHIHTNYKVKYTEYLSSRDFEIKFTRRLMVVVKELHKKNGVEFLK